jgi:ABC-type amino acid transport system permease subunit
MSSLAIASIVFICVFGSALLGLFLRTSLPKHHLSEDSTGVVKLGTGLIATLAALVFGLLIASAKTSFDKIKDEVTQGAVKIVQLDRALAQYGPETKETRDLFRIAVASVTELIFSGEGSGQAKLDAPERLARIEKIQAKLRELAPRNDTQRSLQSRALELSSDLGQMRWLLIVEGEGAIPTPFLVVLVLWLAIIFLGFGLLSAKNATVVAILFVCALSVSGAIFLIEEMDRPLDGLMKISGAPLHNALTHLGQ